MQGSPIDEPDHGDQELSQFDRADQICDAFEREWIAGRRPRLEEYLGQVPETERDKLLRELEVIKRDYEHPQRETGDEPGTQETIRLGDSRATRPVEVPPERVGRYRIERLLGEGGFGRVYLAHDEQLQRLVAVKVPHGELISRAENLAAYLSEARTVANLDHPHIVPVYDVGATDDCPCYVVSKYVDGCDLATRIKGDRLSINKAAEMVATVATALHYAHTQGVVHRDVKPSNILIESDDRPYVVDFGLALREENIGTGPEHLGTPAYMSPEQASGEGHRVDARSDIFSLGVVLYELLAGRRPFSGQTQAELLEQLTVCEPQPLREIDEQIPQELERICHKALLKRAAERYATAREMADDLRFFLAEQPSAPVRPAATSSGSPAAPSIQIVPKGLRSFDADDADFFLELLPGPRDREGLPDGLRFWKTRTEETDPNRTFAVGLIYGPSGCGKSSLIKAGLLPRLSMDVIPVYVEASPQDTEATLFRCLRRHFPALEETLSLRDALTALRRGVGLPFGKKAILVVDQFEQWLHGRRGEDATEFIQALRQCDGARVQCILMVRDDFWLAANRFLRAIEARLIEGHNMAMVDLFDTDHAEYVLASFGRAFGKLPERWSVTTEGQRQFLKQAVAGLAKDDRVICVRLALFAEMMKTKDWTPATLKRLGGAQGVGTAFLEEVFSSSGASPEHRFHQHAARAGLQALLPDPGMDLKGHMRTRSELLEACGKGYTAADFDTVIRILDDELRLITPTEPAGVVPAEETVSKNESASTAVPIPVRPAETPEFFQLTHDYLVPSVREWLSRKQKETRRGRAELLLSDRSLTWNSLPEDRFLPSLGEFLTIRLLTNRKRWTEPQRKTVKRAGRVHGRRLGIVAIVLVAIAVAGIQLSRTIVKQQAATLANGKVDSLLKADIAEVPNIVDELRPYRESVDSRLWVEFQNAADDSSTKLHAAIGLLPVDDRLTDYLVTRLLVCTPAQFPVLRDALQRHGKAISDSLWQAARDGQQPGSRRFRAAVTLAALDRSDERWLEFGAFVSDYLTGSVPALQFRQWLDYLRPAREHLAGPLAAILAERQHSAKQREWAAVALAHYQKEQPAQLVEAILLADEIVEFSPLMDALRSHSQSVTQQLRNEIKSESPHDLAEKERDDHWNRKSLAAATLFHLGHSDDIWPLLEFAEDPSLRSFVIYHLSKLRADHNTLAGRLEVEQSDSIRRALLQILGGLDASHILPAERARISNLVRTIYTSAPDPGIHGAAAWCLKRWEIERPELLPGAEVRRPNFAGQGTSESNPQQPATSDTASEKIRRTTPRRWYVNGQGQTLAVIPNPAAQGPSQIDQSYAIGFHEVTVTEFQRFQKDHVVYRSMVPTDDCPVHRVTWYMAAQYCNWLSNQEGIPEEQWIYLPNGEEKFADGMEIKDNYLQLTGYRLPMEAEWEYACRVGTTSSYAFGEPLVLLGRYAQYVLNAAGHSHPVESLLPNEFGLFDMHGNAWEWSHDVSPDTLTPIRDKDVRMLRGGSFSANPSLVLSSYRLDNKPDFQHIRFGFRVARSFRTRQPESADADVE